MTHESSNVHIHT